jgi:hypothetical protein
MIDEGLEGGDMFDEGEGNLSRFCTILRSGS